MFLAARGRASPSCGEYCDECNAFCCLCSKSNDAEAPWRLVQNSIQQLVTTSKANMAVLRPESFFIAFYNLVCGWNIFFVGGDAFVKVVSDFCKRSDKLRFQSKCLCLIVSSVMWDRISGRRAERKKFADVMTTRSPRHAHILKT